MSHKMELSLRQKDQSIIYKKTLPLHKKLLSSYTGQLDEKENVWVIGLSDFVCVMKFIR